MKFIKTVNKQYLVELNQKLKNILNYMYSEVKSEDPYINIPKFILKMKKELENNSIERVSQINQIKPEIIQEIHKLPIEFLEYEFYHIIK